MMKSTLFIVFLVLCFRPFAQSKGESFQQLYDSARNAPDATATLSIVQLALAEAERSEDEEKMVQALTLRGQTMARMGLLQEAIDSLHPYLKKHDFSSMHISALYNLLGIYHVYQGNLDSTEFYFLKAYEHRVAAKDSLGMGATLNNLGNLNMNKSNLVKATDYFLRSLRIREAIRDSVGMASTTNNLGLVYYKRENFVEAIQNYMIALTLNRAFDDQNKEALICTNLGNVYDEMVEVDSSFKYYYMAYELAYELADNRLQGIANTNLGVAEMKKGNLDKSEQYLSKALEMRTTADDASGQAITLNELASLKVLRGEYPKAIQLFQQSNQLSEELGTLEVSRENYLGLADAYSKLGDYKNAFFSQERHMIFKDSILNAENQESINELIAEYESEKKEQQIALQQAEIAEQLAQNQRNVVIILALIFVVALLVVLAILIRSRSRKKQALLLQQAETLLREAQIEAAISSQEKERARFAQDLHDGFGQMISILNLNLKSLATENADRHQVFEQSATVLEEMYQELKGICFNLMPQTLIKSGISAAISEFASRVNQTGKLMVETDFFGLDERLTDVQEISLYRITQEWINNIIKYSDADRVSVQITKDEEELTLLIEDNGSGFDAALLTRGKGNGWRNMSARANLMKGELELDTQLGIKGSTLIVNAPVLASVASVGV